MLCGHSLTLGILLFVYLASSVQNSQANGNTMAWQQSIQILIKKYPTEELGLITRQVPLDQVLNEIVKKTGVSIHYSNLPEDWVTAECNGKIQVILACLLGANVNIVFRYLSGSSKDNWRIQPVEVWILQVSSRINQVQQSIASADNRLTVRQAQRKIAEKEKIDNTEFLLELARDPLRRMEAIASLAVEGRKDDLNVRNTLKEALSDKNAGVRAQAVFALALREGEGAIADLQQAMRDESAEVRLIALESAGNDPVILQQALNDRDLNVRQLAITKLTTINKVNHEY
jgi:hypothetical protein